MSLSILPRPRLLLHLPALLTLVAALFSTGCAERSTAVMSGTGASGMRPIAPAPTSAMPHPFGDKHYVVKVMGDKSGGVLDASVWPGRQVADKYYWVGVGAVRQRFHLNDDFAPEFMLVLHAPANRVCINLPGECEGYIALEMTKWDRVRFVDGVTKISIYELHLYDPLVNELSLEAQTRAKSSISTEELKQGH